MFTSLPNFVYDYSVKSRYFEEVCIGKKKGYDFQYFSGFLPVSAVSLLTSLSPEL